MQKHTAKPNIAICMAAVLLVMTLLTVCFMPNGLYARYRSNGDANDGARVAAFDIGSVLKRPDNTVISNIDISSMKPGQTKDFQIAVTNNSEVSVQCKITVANETGNLPITLKINGGGPTLTEEYSPNSGTRTYTVTVEWSGTERSYENQGKVDSIVVAVLSEQID